MRQDALVLQMVSFMNGIWLSEHLDLRMITFRCMPVGYRKGMAELVLDCATLCEIQKEFGVTGVFKEDILMNWLMKHNTTEFMYKQALDNFTRSCAGWCVATYVLGIGDRHNDNILVTTAGHVFHIDFGKYMGDWQTAGGFRRDRVPFVFTDEMYHVINGGNQQKESYQTFIDYCCQAFNYLRRNYTILANPLKMMACSDIAGMNVESLNFVEKNLMLELSETDAVIQFTQLINLYKVEVIRESEIVSSYVYRSFNEFNELYIKLRRRFPTVAFPPLSSGTRMRSNVREVAQRRMVDIESFLRYLFTLSPEICHCDLVYTFFHLILRDSNIHSYIGTEESVNESHRSQCEVYLKIQYNGNKQHSQLSIFVGHVKHLALLTTGQAPDAYVKSYIRPDPQNLTKKKTQVVKASQNPTFNREMYYDIAGGENVLSTRVLEVSVWNSGGLMDNNKLYLLYIPLQKLRNRPEDRKGNRVLEGWFAFDKNV
ncbi:C2 domain protein [Teladorsagia circumcincta]|uniref:C2 domain protein n=1 Tax=Teladorsagia circumcincta TaxID=45464 RepID=A0A2G9UTB0_TELCI|nr:C2 domain protein [Teladorsagia circumcincta]